MSKLTSHYFLWHEFQSVTLLAKVLVNPCGWNWVQSSWGPDLTPIYQCAAVSRLFWCNSSYISGYKNKSAPQDQSQSLCCSYQNIYGEGISDSTAALGLASSFSPPFSPSWSLLCCDLTLSGLLLPLQLSVSAAVHSPKEIFTVRVFLTPQYAPLK